MPTLVFRLIVLGFAWLLFCQPVQAVVIFLKGSDEPVKALTIRESDTTITVGVPQADGTFVERVIVRANIEDMLVTVKPDRLAELSPDNPGGYRDYAEELAEKREDPDARAAAIRLYLIAAHLEPQTLGRGSLLGMTALARTTDELRRMRAMLYLLDPAHDGSVLVAGGRAKGITTVDSPQPAALARAVRELRRGHGPVALRAIETPEMKTELARYTDVISFDELAAACAAPKSLSAGTLAKLVRLELLLLGGEEKAADRSRDAAALPSWSQSLATGETSPARPVSLLTLTEFDPRLCVFRDGAWVAP